MIQESVKLAFCMQIPGVCQSQGKFSNIFLINCHLGGHLVRILFLYFIWLQAKCPQLDSNFIADSLRKKMGLRHFSISHKLTSILDAILNISKCSMMPAWHHSDFSRTMYALQESTKKKSLKSSSRSS